MDPIDPWAIALPGFVLLLLIAWGFAITLYFMAFWAATISKAFYNFRKLH